VLVNLEIQFVWTLRAHEVAGAVERIDRAIRARCPIARQLFIETRSITDAGPPAARPGAEPRAPAADDRRGAAS